MRKELFKKYTANGLTDTGNVRQHNEDNILIDDQLALYIVADGMGGHKAGEIASLEAINIIQQILRLQSHHIKKNTWLSNFFNKNKLISSQLQEKKDQLNNALNEANHHVYQLNIERNLFDGKGMGTTVAGCWFISTKILLIFHIGDSRIYRLRNKKLEPLSKDHSALQEWYDTGCKGDKPKSNVIFKAIGPYIETSAKIQSVQIQNDDAFLICSDGLTDMLDDSEIETIINNAPLSQCCNNLLQAALNKSGKDNISIILLNQD